MFIERFSTVHDDFAQEKRRVCHFGGGGGGGQTTTVQKSDPWSQQQAFLSGNANPNLPGSGSPIGVFQSAAQLYSHPSDYPQYYPTSTVQGFNPMESNSLGQLYNTGLSGTPALNSAGNALTAFNNGSFLSAGNPYFSSMADSVKASVIPQLEQQFTQGNMTDNPNVAYATAQGASAALAPYAYQNYSDQLQNMLKSAALAPTQQQAQLQGIDTAFGAGQTAQQQQQSELSDQVNRWNYNQELPYQMLNQYANTVNGQYGGTSTLSQPYYQNGMSNALSGAAAGGMLGNLLFPAAAGGTAFGAMGGAGLGALLAFSDSRLKKNIRRIGQLASGLSVYAFEYLWSTAKHVGVIAQEVEKVIPEAVSELGGFKVVDYARIR